MASLEHHCVLVVEDEYYLAMDVVRLLKSAGARVLGPFPDQEEAQAAVEGERPDCAVLDVNLGAGARFTLADRLREIGVPFLFFTGYDRDVIPERFAQVLRLEKPVGDVRLLSSVETLCCAN
ncbi:MAG: response regulator [Caulobacteraceae bacterium]|nr:response regulator [Caulobacter sp.]